MAFNFGRSRQSEIYIQGMSGIRPLVPVNSDELEQRARQFMTNEAYAYMAGGAGRESTMDANRHALDRWKIIPHMLHDVSQRDSSVTLFGDKLAAPFLLAPIGVLEMAHREADRAVAKAAAAEGIPMIFSNQASVPMEETAAAMRTGVRWFQLYWSQSDELVLSFVKRAEACGCRAIVITLDTTMLGWRPRDLDLGSLPFMRGMGIAQYTSDPVFQASLHAPQSSEMTTGRRRLTPSLILNGLQLARSGGSPRAVQQFVATYSRPSLTWENLKFLRDKTTLPILLKGILREDDARKALDHGINGIIVSNHGGRQVDGAIASIDALPGVVQAVGGQIPVLMDSGIRSGADIFKALALGAAAVCLGRPFVYGLAIGGERGVREVLQNFKADFDLTLGLAGYTSVRDVTRDALLHT